MQQIKKGIYYEGGYLGVTIGALVYSHGTIYIDSPLRSEDARAWRSTLLNQRGGINRLLVSLDAHIDRTLGARALDCSILAHQKSVLAFRNRPSVFKGETMETGADWENYPDAIGMRWAIPDLTFNRRISLHWGGPEILLEHQPGPAAGAIWVIIPEEKVVFVGDAILVNQPPFLSNADLDAWLEGLESLITSYRNYTIISGRGGPVAAEVIRTQQRILKKITKGLDKLAIRNGSPEHTEKMIPKILEDLHFRQDRTGQYTKRLRYGLYQYYLRHFRVIEPQEQTTPEEDPYRPFNPTESPGYTS